VCTRGKETKIISLNRYIRFVEISSGLIKESRIPLYSSKFSKKTYNQHQLLILILLKEYLSDDYRDTVDLKVHGNSFILIGGYRILLKIFKET
jgi:hypothetical protein